MGVEERAGGVSRQLWCEGSPPGEGRCRWRLRAAAEAPGGVEHNQPLGEIGRAWASGTGQSGVRGRG